MQYNFRQHFSHIVVVSLFTQETGVHISNDNGSSTSYLNCFLSSINAKTLIGLYIRVIQQVSYKKKELLTLCKLPSSPRFLVGPCCSSFYLFNVVLLCVFSFLVLWCDVRYDFRIKTMFGWSVTPVVCRMVHVFLIITIFMLVCG
jgi:hypothetical protein